jgi:hypothetical protein
MERGELQGQMQWSLDALLATHSDWIKEHKINLLAQTGYEPDPRFPDLPLAINFARSPADRQLIELIFDAYEAARLYVAPPGVPPDRLNALRKAFMAAVYDKDFLAAAEKAKIDVFKPAPADRVIALIRKAYAAPRSVIDRAKSLFN